MKKLFNVDFIRKMTKVELILFFGFLFAQIIVSILFDNTIISFIIFVSNFLYIVCASYKSLWLFVAGTICPLFVAYVCYINGLYGQVILNLLCFIPLQIVGLVNWVRELRCEETGKNIKNEIQIRRLKYVEIIISATIFLCIFFVTQLLLSKLDGQVLSYADAFVTVGSLFGTVLITFKYVENWWVYLAVNFVSAIMWLKLAINGAPEAASLCITQIAFTTWTIIGLIKWEKGLRRSVKAQKTKGVFLSKDD